MNVIRNLLEDLDIWMLFQMRYRPIVIYFRIRGTFILDESISSLRFLRVCYGTKRVISSPNYILLKGSIYSRKILYLFYWREIQTENFFGRIFGV